MVGKRNLVRRNRKRSDLRELIAALALALDVTLVTNNTKEFRRVAGLRIVDWTKTEGA